MSIVLYQSNIQYSLFKPLQTNINLKSKLQTMDYNPVLHYYSQNEKPGQWIM